MRELVKVMKALSDPGRVKVLKMLEAREMCACEIIGLLGLAQPTVSRHLKVLVDAGLIKGRKVGSWVHYRLAPASIYAQAMLAALPGWLEADPEILAMRQTAGRLVPLGSSAQPSCCGPAPANP
ncbi:MAG: metalloregulator ArsR/SmtB family transcription factor [Proteobacteria bacterium]|nr:metalloregulator ArsR/SmtB family transcription factor [Pseudomonadota bacterium]MBU1596298.1 metalloregulator ArsR/SmtB family transcription factor [Pseudomonadota bacterium]